MIGTKLAVCSMVYVGAFVREYTQTQRGTERERERERERENEREREKECTLSKNRTIVEHTEENPLQDYYNTSSVKFDLAGQ